MRDKERLKNEGFLGRDYFEELLDVISEIRASERKFYQKITDIYATALDYNPDSHIPKHFLLQYKTKCILQYMGKPLRKLFSIE